MDVLVTVKEEDWDRWLEDGDLAGDPWSGQEHGITVMGHPKIEHGERVYILAGGIVRGYAPLIRAEVLWLRGKWRTTLFRGGGARAMTPMCVYPTTCDCMPKWQAPHPKRIVDHHPFQYRSWKYTEEWALIDWKDMPGQRRDRKGRSYGSEQQQRAGGLPVQREEAGGVRGGDREDQSADGGVHRDRPDHG